MHQDEGCGGEVRWMLLGVLLSAKHSMYAKKKKEEEEEESTYLFIVDTQLFWCRFCLLLECAYSKTNFGNVCHKCGSKYNF